eukprot:579069-Rhodomonas_salina.1
MANTQRKEAASALVGDASEWEILRVSCRERGREGEGEGVRDSQSEQKGRWKRRGGVRVRERVVNGEPRSREGKMGHSFGV